MAGPRRLGVISTLEAAVFGRRRLVVLAFALVTILMGWFAAQLRIDAGFTKLLPLEHPYMETFMKYRQDFGGANRIVIALMSRRGDIFNGRGVLPVGR